jgi:signal transduction histidine kinase
VFMFDWRALRRWGFRESNLPPGSVVLNRQPTAWESYKWYIIGGVSLIVAEMLLIFGLVWQRARRRSVEVELAFLSGSLIEAHEEERRRIARELHDDFNQRLAMLAFDLERASQMIADSPLEARERLRDLWNRAAELGDDLHSLSHRLHSSTLENLGLALGLSSLCHEFTELQGIQVDFAHENISREINPDVALCIFRIVQEALRNVKKHSGANRAEVRLRGEDDQLYLSVSDAGIGFDKQQRPNRAGIGIRSMEERLRLVGGRIDIVSRRNRGTTLKVYLPCKEP